ncbi:M20 family metallopeptidase [Sedimentibacter sp. MB31-C6]|uniref:M20 family metallopeptidase n=1 Tax=Sedimentibacter sp. MB31-C6 TaxID=3109366 RepID=UPI002DDD604B|nr:M20/M25/M40 family metallo-hydrolase [Sedimentibacter sp. MB36-C1]WSI04825.1 M20/M25/M40 family metallo-hydrolase [Sedimentibacter sp. MB36-C1]
MYKIEKDQTTKLLMDLVSIESPYFEEEKIMDFVYKWFQDNNIEAAVHEYHESKVTGFKGKNIIVKIEGKEDGPVICLNGHLDTVKLCNGWTVNPKGEIKDDKLYGVGALDMKSGCAATMIALKAFVENHKDFKGKIISTYVSVEEGPYGMGTNALIEEGYLKDVDFSIITEPSAGFSGNQFPDVCLGARGGYGLEIEFFGVSSHAATPEIGVNAAEAAAKVVGELKNVEYIEDPHLGKGTACVVALESDGGACSVPDYAKVRLFWHIVVGESEKTITDEIEKAIKRANIDCEYKINFREAPSEGSKGFMPYTITGEEPMSKDFIETIEEVCETKPSISYFQSIGDFNYLGSRLGAPAIIFGASGGNFHGSDEYAELDSVVKIAEVVYSFLEKVLCS